MCTDFIILKGLYIKKKTKKKTRKRIHESIERITHSLTCLWYSTDPEDRFRILSRPDERGRLSKHPNTRDIRRRSRCQILSEGYQEVL